MRKFLSRVFVLAGMLAVAACGGGGGSSFETPGTPGGGTGNNPAVAAVSVTSSSATMVADAASTATITAMVRDANNTLLPGVAVTFSANSGGVAVTQGTTDALGVAKATLSPSGDLSLRTITVTATASGVSATTNVAVVAPPPLPTAASMTLVTSTPTINSSGATTATITAIVRNSSNQFLANVPVQFSTTAGGGGLTVANAGVTDASGKATAVLDPASDPTNRPITVQATSGSVTQTVNVDVVGTTLVVQGPTALANGQTATYTVILANSSAAGIPGKTVTVTSARGNTVALPSPASTSANGQLTFNVTVTQQNSDILSVSSLGMTTPLPVTVNNDNFKFTAPVPVAPATTPELAISPAASPVGIPVTINWTVAGVAQANKVITFSSTRGTFMAPNASGQATTDANGTATLLITSTNAGLGTITASSGVGGSTAQQAVEFVATSAASLELQASNFTVGPKETSTLTAVVRDSVGNLVKNKTVSFTLTDVSGGQLSAGTGITDSNGRAQTIYTAGSSTSAQNGVAILAQVQGTASANDTANLTVAKREVFISIGTGNTIEEPNDAQYKKNYIVQVTDANGNGVANVPVSMAMLSQRYFKGYRKTAVVGVTGWATCYTTVGVGQTPSQTIPGTPPQEICTTGVIPTSGCGDEDTNRNGVLDAETFTDVDADGVYDVGEPFLDTNGNSTRDRGEDRNDSNKVEAGNIASVSPSNVVTDASGFAIVSVFYPQEYAYWVEVSLQGRTSVQGTEFTRASTFLLPGSVPDFTGTGTPPGPTSPFGVGQSCTDTK